MFYYFKLPTCSTITITIITMGFCCILKEYVGKRKKLENSATKENGNNTLRNINRLLFLFEYYCTFLQEKNNTKTMNVWENYELFRF